jgi:hypothetical protein
MKLTPCFAVLLAVSSSALALQLPTDIDLKAAYCLRVSQMAWAGYQPGRFAFVDRMAAEDQDRVNRLKSYLLPRMSYLDATGLVMASKRGEVDQAQYSQHFNNLEVQCAQDASAEICMSRLEGSMEAGLRTRIHTCNKLDWLPF